MSHEGQFPRFSAEDSSLVIDSYLIYRKEEIIEILSNFDGKEFNSNVIDVLGSLCSIITVASLPFTMTSSAIHRRRFDSFLAAERIRSLKIVPPGERVTDEPEKQALVSAENKMLKFLESEDGINWIRDSIVMEMRIGLDSEELSSAAHELLGQSIISLWSTFERFSSGFARQWVNADPSRAKMLLDSSDLRNYFGRQTLDIEIIESHGYILNNSMGDIIFKGKRLDSLKIIRAVYEVLFSTEAVRSSLGDHMWILNQRRNLLVHNRGIVDAEYRKKTGDLQDIGDKIVLKSDDLVSSAIAVQNAVIAIISAAIGKGHV